MADFASIEEREGLRLSWNLWPNSKVEATKCVLPFGALYTPIKDLPDIPVRPALCVSMCALLSLSSALIGVMQLRSSCQRPASPLTFDCMQQPDRTLALRSFKEEANADKAIKALTAALAPQARALRDGRLQVLLWPIIWQIAGKVIMDSCVHLCI